MNQIKIPKDKCLPTCHQIRFTSTRMTTKIDVENICSIPKQPLLPWSKELLIARDILYENGIQYHKYKNIKDWLKLRKDLGGSSKANLEKFNFNQEIEKICTSIVAEDIIKVSVMFESEEYLRTKSEIKVTLMDRLSNLGRYVLIYFVGNTYNIQICCNIFLCLNRRNTWIVYWNEFSKYDGIGILA